MSTETPAAPTELTLSDALKLAIEMQQNQQYDGAETLYRRILQAVPEQPDALHFLGMLLYQRGRADEGIGLIEQALAIEPAYASARINLGNIQASRGELEAATRTYQGALALAGEHGPEAADLHNNLGALYKAQRRFDEARAAYERALALSPQHVRAHNNMGLLYAELGDRGQAIAWYVQALELIPGDASARRLLGTTYYAAGRIADAAEVYRQWLAIEPDNPTPRHMLAACSGENVPARAADDYVERAFDNFAESFESVLNERLHYQAPQLCAGLLARWLPPPQRQLVMLDAGAGTGLCGPLMAPWARTLAGVDLSRRMLDMAQTKGVYQDLYKAELTQFLQLSAGHWDVVLSADTLCYFGDLGPVLRAAGAALRPAGTLVFTVEALAEDSPLDHQIQPHGRYAHHARHLDATLLPAGLQALERQPVVLREEGGQPVAGWLVAARRPAELR